MSKVNRFYFRSESKFELLYMQIYFIDTVRVYDYFGNSRVCLIVILKANKKQRNVEITNFDCDFISFLKCIR